MRTLSYLTHTLLSRTTPKINNKSQCNSPYGAPGAVYLCHDSSCAWIPPSISTKCMPYADIPLPNLIGPDPSGYCLLYKDAQCSEMIAPFEGSYDIICPGINAWIPVEMRGIKCFACDGECHPPRMEKIEPSGSPKPEDTPAPIPKDPPASKPEEPPAPKPEELPVAPKPAYVRLPN